MEKNTGLIDIMIATKCVIDPRGNAVPVSHAALFVDKFGIEHVVFIPHVDVAGGHGYEYITLSKLILGSDNKAHISNISLPGTLMIKFHGGLDKAICAYNEADKKMEKSLGTNGRFKLLVTLSDSEESPAAPVEYLA